MQQPTKQTFGLVIAYLIPGWLALIGLACIFPESQHWIVPTAAEPPTVGGFLYVTLASIGAGLTVSSIRWLLVDNLHHLTGIRKPAWDFSALGQNVAAYSLLVEFHYRYYQFYGGVLIATAFTYPAFRLSGGLAPSLLATDFAVLLIEAIYFASSRDTLRKYYERAGDFLDAEHA